MAFVSTTPTSCPACGMYDPCLCKAGVFNGIGSTHQAPHGNSPAAAYAKLAAQQNHALYQASIYNSLAQQNAQQALNSPGLSSGLGDLVWGTRMPWGQVLPPPPEPLEKAETRFEEFVGWRIWQIKEGYLASYSSEYVWAPGEPAQGEPGDHDSAGLWAFKDKGKALHKLLGQSTPSVMGSVWLYGDVVEHTIGYRAQYATVRSLDHVVFKYDESHKGPLKWLRTRAEKREVLDALREIYGAEA